jgi:hypothetical protein
MHIFHKFETYEAIDCQFTWGGGDATLVKRRCVKPGCTEVRSRTMTGTWTLAELTGKA